MDYENETINWGGANAGHGLRFLCAHCGADAAAMTMIPGQRVRRSDGAAIGGPKPRILFCSVCSQPSYFDLQQKQIPAPRLGAALNNVPADGLRQLYEEARACSTVGAYTACVMVCRKILMNLAVREGAKEGLPFGAYVAYLEQDGHMPKKGKAWVDRIRTMGNEANHEIAQKTEEDAKAIVQLVEMLLRFNYELGVPGPTPAPGSTAAPDSP